ncbi:MAG: PadR family transcriptional regulator [Candidatus Hodarchaeota archaeon]
MFGKDLEITPTESLFLLILFNDENLSGSDIIKSVKDDLGEEWSPTPGATYKIIQKLIEKNYISETTEIEKKDRDKRIRTYSLTHEGRKMVVKVIARIQRMVGFIDSCCPNGGPIVIFKRSESDES